MIVLGSVERRKVRLVVCTPQNERYTMAGQRSWRQEQEKRQHKRERDEAWGVEADRLKEDEEEKVEEEQDERKRGGEG